MYFNPHGVPLFIQRPRYEYTVRGTVEQLNLQSIWKWLFLGIFGILQVRINPDDLEALNRLTATEIVLAPMIKSMMEFEATGEGADIYPIGSEVLITYEVYSAGYPRLMMTNFSLAPPGSRSGHQLQLI